jgi:hypothetical protein
MAGSDSFSFLRSVSRRPANRPAAAARMFARLDEYASTSAPSSA